MERSNMKRKKKKGDKKDGIDQRLKKKGEGGKKEMGKDGVGKGHASFLVWKCQRKL